MHITLPSQFQTISETSTTGVFEIAGLAPGYGFTLGNSLRRIILSSLPGAAITSIAIDGVAHEFSSIAGIREDVITMILHLKKVRFELIGDEPVTATLPLKFGAIHAKDFVCTGQLSVTSPDQYICEVTDKSKTGTITVTVAKGLGYVAREMHTKDKTDIGVIALDANFTPIHSVAYEVENMRVGDRVDHNKLRMTIITDGSIKPSVALQDSLMIMLQQFKAILDLKYDFEFPTQSEPVATSSESVATLESEPMAKTNAVSDMNPEDLTDILKTRIDSVAFGTRTLNALSDAGIRTIGGLIQKSNENLLELPGFGQKGLSEVTEILAGYNLTLKQ
jgi:DNA-directed RNA polymerase subunit alpha